MYLKKIEMQGFKSFADRCAIELDIGVTAIIGPNGSGKSNISDAVRWVLGEQSIKSLRGSKLEDVIFSGTEHRKPSGFAEVTLIFDNGDGGLKAPFSEVSVTRRVFRSGESEYLINRSRCRLKDINELFFDTGVGREGYTIIGQGKVDEILNNKPEERRGIFEEAAGIMKYKIRRVEAERKLDHTSQNLDRITDIITELESKLVVLGEQAKIARRYLSIRDELRGIEVAAYVASITRYDAELSRCAEDRKAADGEYRRHTNARRDIETILGQKETRAAGIEDVQSRLRDEIAALDAGISDRKNSISVNEERIRGAEKDTERIKNELALTGQRNAARESELSQNRLKRQYLLDELLTYDKLLKDKKHEYDRVISSLSESDAAIGKKKLADVDIQNSYYESKNTLTRLYTEIGHLDGRIAATEASAGTWGDEISGDETTRDELIIQKARMDTRTEELHSRLKELSLARYEMADDIERGSKDIEEKTSRLNQIRTRARVLSDMEESFEGFYQSVRRVLSQARHDGRFGDGICGAFASIITAPKEYELAISMALGAAQQNIVTADERAAGHAISFLKRVGGGRATFMPLTSVRGRILERGARPEGRTGYIGVASELVAYDKQYEKAVNELLGRTCVVDTLDNAVKISKERGYLFRIVTLDGDILTTGGIITGGSTDQRQSGLISRHREVSELRDTAERLSLEIERLSGSHAALEDKLTALKSESAAVERTINDHQVAEASLIARLSNIERKLATDMDRLALLLAEREEAQRVKRETEDEISKTENRCEALLADMERVRSAIDLYAEQNKADTQNRDSLLKTISECNVSLASVTEARNAVELNIERLVSELSESGKGIAAHETHLGKLERDSEGFQLEITAWREELARAELEKKGKQLKVESTTAERASIREELRELSRETDRLGEVIADIQREQSRLAARDERIRAELAHCNERLAEDYELTYEAAVLLIEKNAVLWAMSAEDEESTDYAAGVGNGSEAKPVEADRKTARRAAKLREEIRGLGYVNVLAIDEYTQTKARYDNITTQRDDLSEASEKLRGIIADMSKVMRKNFREQFALINENFNTVFKELFRGGRAQLSLTDESDILSAGVEIEIQLPGKRMQNMLLYSGGERAMTAIALIFAMLKLKPVPFCLLDEIESALDEANVERFSRYIRSYCDTTQFIMVTHRKGTMEGSNVLYGVTMQERGVSGVAAIKIG